MDPAPYEDRHVNATTEQLVDLGTRWHYVAESKQVLSVPTQNILDNHLWTEVFDSNVAAIESFSEHLKQEEIEFYLFFIPGPITMYPDWILGPEFAPDRAPPVNQRVREMAAELSKRGVNVVDLNEIYVANRFFEFEGQQYQLGLVNDGHWSPMGARLAAETVGARILAEQRDRLAPYMVPNEELSIQARLAHIPGGFVDKGLLKNLVEMETPESPIFRVVSSNPNSKLLLDSEPTAPVWIVSESNGSIYSSQSAGFHAHLARTLKTPCHPVVCLGSVHIPGAGRVFRSRRIETCEDCGDVRFGWLCGVAVEAEPVFNATRTI